MRLPKSIWLLANARSGSNSEAAREALRAACEEQGIGIDRTICLPKDDLPDPVMLDEGGCECLAIFTGDGTLNAAITGLYGWGGAVLVLPGGTMNLLSTRMHGQADVPAILERFAHGAMRRWRPQVARCEVGDALAGLLVGPGTAWSEVREAMRDIDLAATAESATQALSETAGGIRVRCAEPSAGREDGYPLVSITPSHRGMKLDGYYADDWADFARQSLAVLRRDFRQGPHESLGLFDDQVFQSCGNGPIGVLIDGEPAELPPRARIALASCEVDLLASDHGF